MSDLVVSWAAINDFLEIAELDRISWLHNRNSEFIPDGEHVWRHWVEHGYVCVAKQNQEIAGVALSFASTRPKFHFLHKVFLAKSYTGQGVGRKLLKVLCEKYDENKISVQLTTDTNNMAMQCLAERMGFSEKELVKGYYRENEDRWVYTRVPG
ncbi:MAG: GNAT family N-acetyltransferase [Gammaproteobacteria bacterium]|nr:MAG: GNAT family N-acetyltransferase [Gammaproteobacteria bacterium]